MRLGLLGGTFDPPHYGHLVAAQDVACRLHLDRVVFLPARQNPLKRGERSSSPEDRCEMVRLAIHDNPLFELSRLDLERPGPSYTADLLRSLAAPDRHLFFMLGADILPELPRWRQPDEILRLARLVVVSRHGSPAADLDALERVLPGARAHIEMVEIPGVAIASRELRQRVAAGLPVRYLTPPLVDQYILDKCLYRRKE
jgi:nicotinate-nucleotide adenylyltransferase